MGYERDFSWINIYFIFSEFLEVFSFLIVIKNYLVIQNDLPVKIRFKDNYLTHEKSFRAVSYSTAGISA
ncbi:hypothetical protein BH23BAC1_BH23BAC1_16410 [soil metagenome]